MLIAIVLSFLSGVTRTVSRMVNAQLSESIGPFQSTFYHYGLGLICSGLILFLSREPWPAAPLTAGPIPAWAYWGGGVGVLFIILSNIVTPKMSAFAMTLLIFGGQIGAGMAIDVFIHQQFSLGQLAGGVLIMGGLLGNLMIDKNRQQARL